MFILLTSKVPNALGYFQDAVDSIFQPSLFEQYMNELPSKAMQLALRVLLSILVFIIGYNLIKLVRKVVHKSMEKGKADKGVITFIDSFLKVGLYVVLIIVIAELFGFDAAGLSALIASAGVTVGLALQGSLSNLAGGILILLTKPFTVGDYIVDSGTGTEGTVKEIQICYTKLLTADNRLVILPNGSMANSATTNVTKEKYRRIDINVGISYSADIDTAKDALMKMLDEDEFVIQKKEKRVAVTNLGNSSVDLIVRFWVEGKNYWDAKFKLTEDTKKTLDKVGISIPFPQLDVHMQKD